MTNSSTPIDPSRRSGARYSQQIDNDKDSRSKAKTFRPLLYLWPFVTRYPVRLIGFLFFLALSTLMTLGMSFVIRAVTDCGMGKGENVPAYCAKIDTINAGALNGLLLMAIVFALFYSLISSTRAYLINTLGQRVVSDIRISVYNHLLKLSPSYYERVRTGEILSRLTTDTTLVETVVTGSISFALRSVATTIGALVVMFIVSWKLTSLVFIVGPLIVLPALRAGGKIRKLSRDGQDTLADASARAGESLSNIQTVQAFTREQFESDNFEVDVENTYSKNQKRLLIRAFLMSFIMAGAMIAIASIIWFGATGVSSGKMNGGSILQFSFLAFLVISSTSMLTETWTNLLRAAGASERLSEILQEEPDIIAMAPIADINSISDDQGKIEFKDVSFSYPTRPEEQALVDVSFTIKAGETVALVGPSGAGKTTIFQLLLRFYDPQSGTISMSNLDIKSLNPADLRSQFAIVQQATPLFTGSALDNIRYGRVGSTEQEAKDAAIAANADHFIQALPNAYQTDLGEKATTLSGGQQQRIAIARAIVRDAPILLLDEATSALDAHSEQVVQQAFENMAKDRTTIVIAHRLATVKSADRILVMDGGKIVDQGRHDELVARGGLYAKLAKLQFTADSKNDAS